MHLLLKPCNHKIYSFSKVLSSRCFQRFCARFTLPDNLRISPLRFGPCLSKALIPGVVLPIGIITALVGVPLFMALVLRGRRVA